jgi:hypothetical protein
VLYRVLTSSSERNLLDANRDVTMTDGLASEVAAVANSINVNRQAGFTPGYMGAGRVSLKAYHHWQRLVRVLILPDDSHGYMSAWSTLQIDGLYRQVLPQSAIASGQQVSRLPQAGDSQKLDKLGSGLSLPDLWIVTGIAPRQLQTGCCVSDKVSVARIKKDARRRRRPIEISQAAQSAQPTLQL